MGKEWSHAVTTRPAATFAPGGLHTKSAEEIYLAYRKPSCSPNGLGSAIQMLIFFINRAGRNLSEERKQVLWQAVEYLRIELEHLRHPNGLTPRNEERFLKNLANEVAYQLLRKQLQLDKQPKPVHPIPPPERRVGGRYVHLGNQPPKDT